MTGWKKACGREAELIAVVVAEEHGLTVADLKGPKTHRIYSRARQQLMTELAATGRYSKSSIARFLGDRHPSTVKYGLRAYQEPPAPKPVARVQQDPDGPFIDRLLWQYGPERTASILAETDPATQADIAAWKALGT